MPRTDWKARRQRREEAKRQAILMADAADSAQATDAAEAAARREKERLAAERARQLAEEEAEKERKMIELYKEIERKTKKFASGAQYFGDFVEPVPRFFWLADGYGELSTVDLGRVYEGLFRKGKFCGEGEYTWLRGDKWHGKFRDNLLYGAGVYTFADGSQRPAFFERSRRVCWLDELAPGVRLRVFLPGHPTSDASVLEVADGGVRLRVKFDRPAPHAWIDLRHHRIRMSHLPRGFEGLDPTVGDTHERQLCTWQQAERPDQLTRHENMFTFFANRDERRVLRQALRARKAPGFAHLPRLAVDRPELTPAEARAKWRASLREENPRLARQLYGRGGVDTADDGAAVAAEEEEEEEEKKEEGVLTVAIHRVDTEKRLL